MADDTDDTADDDKDAIIANLRAEVSRLTKTVTSLENALAREHGINDVLLSERRLRDELSSRPLAKTSSPPRQPRDDLNDCESPISQPITPAQRGRVNISQSADDDDNSNLSSPSNTAAQGSPVSNSRSEEEVNTNATIGSDRPELADLHAADIARSKKLSYYLNSFKNLPHDRNVIIFGDSNLNGIKENLIDAVSKSVVVRGCSGLCIPAAAYALKNFKYKYKHVKRVLWSVGTNDFLHDNQHCQSDWIYHLEDLISESKRVFPKAIIGIIMPFHGLPEVPPNFISFINKSVKGVSKAVKTYTAPTMRNKVNRDGVHINSEGARVFEEYVKNTFLARRQPNQDVKIPQAPLPRERQIVDQQRCDSDSGAQYSHQSIPSHYQPGSSHGGNGHNIAFPYPPPPYFRPQVPPIPPLHGQIVRNISEAVAAALLTSRQNGVSHYM